MAAGRWMPQRSAAERKAVSTASSSKKFFSVGFRLTGSRGGRFSPATDVITFSGLPPPHICPTSPPTAKFLFKAYKNN
jgi:hypothetical protein